jgi:hypothetical protein
MELRTLKETTILTRQTYHRTPQSAVHTDVFGNMRTYTATYQTRKAQPQEEYQCWHTPNILSNSLVRNPLRKKSIIRWLTNVIGSRFSISGTILRPNLRRLPRKHLVDTSRVLYSICSRGGVNLAYNSHMMLAAHAFCIWCWLYIHAFCMDFLLPSVSSLVLSQVLLVSKSMFSHTNVCRVIILSQALTSVEHCTARNHSSPRGQLNIVYPNCYLAEAYSCGCDVYYSAPRVLWCLGSTMRVKHW